MMFIGEIHAQYTVAEAPVDFCPEFGHRRIGSEDDILYDLAAVNGFIDADYSSEGVVLDYAQACLPAALHLTVRVLGVKVPRVLELRSVNKESDVVSDVAQHLSVGALVIQGNEPSEPADDRTAKRRLDRKTVDDLVDFLRYARREPYLRKH